MKLRFIELFALILLMGGCTMHFYPRHYNMYSRVGGQYSTTASAGYYDYYARQVVYNQGYATPQQVKEALKEAKEYEDEAFLANYSHSQYEFQFAKDSVIVGKPIQVVERNEEMITALTSGEKFVKTEHYNDNVSFQGFTSNLAGEYDTSYKTSSYVESQVRNNGIFYSDAKTAFASWNLPVPGSSVRIRSGKVYNDAKYFSLLFFHEGYPQKERVITFKVPTWIDLQIIERNFDGYNIRRSDSMYVIGKKMKKKADPNMKVTPNNNSSKPQKASAKAVKTDKKGNYRYITYVFNRVEGLKDEALAAGPTHNLPHLVVLCKGFDSTEAQKNAEPVVKDKKAKNKTTPTPTKKTKNSKEVPVVERTLPENIKGTIANTKDLYIWSHEIAKLTDNNLDSVKTLAQEIVKGKTSDYDKVEAIYYWVQDNIRYVAFEDGIAAFKPDACQNVLSKRYGDCKGMANLIKSMLVALGFDARLTWIGTSRLNMDYSIPTVAASNHMICAITLNGKRYFLDGTEKFVGMGDYAHRIQGRPVMIEDGDNYIIDTVPTLSPERNLHYREANFKVALNGEITGDVKETISGENKVSLFNKYYYTEKPYRKYVLTQHLKDYDPNFTASNIKSTGFENRKQDLVLNYKLAIHYNQAKSDKVIMIKADFISELKGHDGDTDRMYNIAYGHKLNYLHDYNFEIPLGFAIKQVPENLSIESDEYIFRISYEVIGNRVRYKKHIVLKSGYVAKKNVKQWNVDISKLSDAYNKYIVLEKN